MKVVLVNGSPRKNWNTHQLLKSAERACADVGADTVFVDLYDLDYKDCISCFACKLKGNKTDGVCPVNDALKPVLNEIKDAEGLIIGSPIYFSDITGETVAFLNRLMFPSMHYQNDGFAPLKKKKCGLILTMNIPEDAMDKWGYTTKFGQLSGIIGSRLGECEVLYSCDTYQFTDYSKYYSGMFDPIHKAEHREKQFPVDLENAYNLGKRICNQ